MLIVTGDLVAREGEFAVLFAAGRAHSQRSRAEPGCLGHDCFADPEVANRLFFFERWSDQAALDVHMATPGVQTLLAAIKTHAAQRGTLQVYRVAADRA